MQKEWQHFMINNDFSTNNVNTKQQNTKANTLFSTKSILSASFEHV